MDLIFAWRGGFVLSSRATFAGPRCKSDTPTSQLSIDLVRSERPRSKVSTQPFPSRFLLGMGFLRECFEQLSKYLQYDETNTNPRRRAHPFPPCFLKLSTGTSVLP